MSKASEYAARLKAKPPEFMSERAEVIASVTEKGDLWIGTPADGNICIPAKHAVELAAFILYMYQED